MSVTPKTLVDYLLDTLKDSSSLSDIKHFHKGEPPQMKVIGYPYLWVEWNGGRQVPTTVSHRITTYDEFFIVAVDRHPDPSQAEDVIMDFAETIETVLGADHTLNTQVAYSYISNREKQKQFSSDYSVVATRLTLTTKRRKTS